MNTSCAIVASEIFPASHYGFTSLKGYFITIDVTFLNCAQVQAVGLGLIAWLVPRVRNDSLQWSYLIKRKESRKQRPFSGKRIPAFERASSFRVWAYNPGS